MTYCAPEVLEGEHFESKSDMWSLGVLLYTLLAGFLPFQGKDAEEVADNIKAGNYSFDHPEFNSTNVSDECKDLIKNLLKVDP